MSQVYGFKGYQPRAVPYVNKFTGAVIATPVLDLSSVRGPAGLRRSQWHGRVGD
jgi:hypothetical protein